MNLYATVRELPALAFPHQLNNRRDRTDPELVPHLHGFIGFVMKGGDRPMTASLFHVIQHIERVQNHLSVEVEEDALDAMATWAIEANAVLFLPDGTVRDPVGRMLVDPETGAADEEAQVPFPGDAVDRKLRFDKEIAAAGIPVAPGLPPIVGVNEVMLRSPTDVLHRACALLACAIRAEGLNSGDALSVDRLREHLPEAFVALSPSERAFLSTDAPEHQAIVNTLDGGAPRRRRSAPPTALGSSRSATQGRSDARWPRPGRHCRATLRAQLASALSRRRLGRRRHADLSQPRSCTMARRTDPNAPVSGPT